MLRGKWQLVFRLRRLNCLPCHEVGIQSRVVVIADERKVIVGNAGYQMAAFTVHAFAHRALES